MQIGDRVLVSKPATNMKRSMSIGKIVGETKTSWRVKYGDGLGTVKSLFRKTDLRIRVGGDYFPTRIQAWDDEEWRKYQRELLHRTAANALSQFKWNELDTDTLVKIHKLAMEAKRKT